MQKIAIFFIILCHLCVVSPIKAQAQSSLEEELAAMKAQFAAMQEKMSQLEAKIAQQEQKIASDGTSQHQYEERINQLEKQQTSASQSKRWVPEIGVIADTVFTLDSPKTDNADALNLRELELVLGSNVDAFSRLDATIGFSTSDEEPVHLEEAYLTRFGLPLDTTARVGKFKPRVGKVLQLHRDSLDTVDEPLVIQRYFSEEGYAKTGVDVTKNLDLPIPITQQVTVGVLEGGNQEEDEGIFGNTKRRPTIYSHLKNYVDITESTGFELGGTYMTGSRDEDSAFEVQVLAADATLTHHFNATQNMKLQGEVFNVDRKESVVDVEEDDGMGGTITVPTDLDGNIWGAYGLIDFRLHPRWSVGSRYDWVEPIAVEVPTAGARSHDRAYSGYLTFHQSEFARWRAQFTHTDYATGKDGDAIYLQGTFAIGEHKHKIQ